MRVRPKLWLVVYVASCLALSVLLVGGCVPRQPEPEEPREQPRAEARREAEAPSPREKPTAPEPAPQRAYRGRHPEALAYLNEQRRAAGLAPLRAERQLERAAHAHAAYLRQNGAEGHGETPGRPGFTGADPMERARHAGYEAARVGENVAAGAADGREAIDGLMAAIYHRLGFLAFGMDEVGIGMEPGTGGSDAVYVYKLGDSRAALRAFCRAPEEALLHDGEGPYYEVCQAGLRVGPEAFARLTGARARAEPEQVLWPPPGQRGVPPAFFEEVPDPLPDRAVSGYPLSIQLNPQRVRSARLDAFALYRAPGPLPTARVDTSTLEPVTPVRVLHERSDPNGMLGPLQFAMFPLQRLDWDAAYVAEATLVVDGERRTVRWGFRTRALEHPAYVVRDARETPLPLVPGRTYAVYVPPAEGAPLLGRVEYEHPDTARLAVSFIDPNTLRVRLDGDVCDRATLRPSGAPPIPLRLATADTTGGPRPAEALYAPCGENSAHFRLAGQGERLGLMPGRAYRLFITSGAVGSLRWRYPEGASLDVAREGPQTLAATVHGRPCDAIEVSLDDGRRFTLVVAGTSGSGLMAGVRAECGPLQTAE